MLRLPTLIAGSAEWRLPLPEAAAAQLLASLVAPSERRRFESLAQTMKGSPSFLVWAICRDAAAFEAPPETLGGLARRFLPRLLDELNWPEQGRAANRLFSSWEKRWQALADRSTRVAELAASLAVDRAPTAGTARRFVGQVFLLGLLHTACDWLTSCGPAVRIASGVHRASPLPAWLMDRLRRIHEGDDSGGAVSVVRSALLQYTARGDNRVPHSAIPHSVSPHSVSPHNGSSHNSGAHSVNSHSVNSHNGSANGASDAQETLTRYTGNLLPQLAAKLRRLNQLETKFDAVLEQEKLASLRQLAYGASHEINNPLANISTRAQTLLREETNPEKRKRLATINAQAFRAHEMISDMMLFAKPPELSLSAVDMQRLLDTLMKELRPQAEQQGTLLSCVIPEMPIVVRADAVQLSVAIRALCVNSLEALGEGGGSVEIQVAVGRGPDGDSRDWLEIRVRDTGPGVSQEARRHLFDPFYSGREAGRGLGLGLSKCWRIITLHGGRIDLDSHGGPGATFRLRIPVQ